MIIDYPVLSVAGKNVIVSNQPYFYKKAELFPGSAFIIGADTAARLVNVSLLVLNVCLQSSLFAFWARVLALMASVLFFFRY